MCVFGTFVLVAKFFPRRWKNQKTIAHIKPKSPWNHEVVAGDEDDGRVNLSGRGARPRMASMISVKDAKNLFVQELRIQRFFCRR